MTSVAATSSDRYCVMGNPVAHSRSPWIHARFAELCGQDLHYERQHVELDGFTEAVRGFVAAGGRGCNVTVPFKLEAAQLATTSSERVQLAGAANTLVLAADGIHADNTDGLGLVADIVRNAGVPLAGRDLLLLGAGGAAAGALGSLLAERPRRIAVVNRTFERAQALVQRHAAIAAQHGVELVALEQQAVDEDFDVVINATASSLAGAEAGPRAAHWQPGLRHDVRPRGPGLHAVGRTARRHGPRRAGHAGGAGGRIVCAVARRAPALGPGAERAARPYCSRRLSAS